MKRVGGAFVCLLLAVCLLAGCSDPVGKAVEHKDITLILPADFLDLSGESYAKDADFLYGRNTLIFKGLSEKKSNLKAMTLAEYTAYVISGNALSCTPTPYGEGYLFTYDAPVGDTVYSYTTATYAGQENFWILQFYCPKDNLAENQPEIDIILQGIQPK